MRIPVALGLWGIYLLYTGDVSLSSMALGTGAAFLASWLGVPGGLHFRWSSLPRAMAAATKLLGLLIYETLRGSIQVTGLALSRRPALRPRLERIPAPRSEAARAFEAHAISLTPGELVVDDDGKTLLTHVLVAPAGAGAETPIRDRRRALWNDVEALWNR